MKRVSPENPDAIDRIIEFGIDESWRMMDTWWEHGVGDEALLKSDPDSEGVHRAYDAWEVDREAGLEAFLKLAQGGSVWSMIQVARAYRAGWGTTTDHAEAEIWYRRAHAGGSAEATLHLGLIEHIRRDSAKAEAILMAGVAEGLTPAMRRLAHVKLGLVKTRPARDQARRLLERAAALGDLGARCDLIGGQVRGRFGVRYILHGFRGLMPLVRDIIAWMDSELNRRSVAVSQ